MCQSGRLPKFCSGSAKLSKLHKPGTMALKFMLTFHPRSSTWHHQRKKHNVYPGFVLIFDLYSPNSGCFHINISLNLAPLCTCAMVLNLEEWSQAGQLINGHAQTYRYSIASHGCTQSSPLSKIYMKMSDVIFFILTSCEQLYCGAMMILIQYKAYIQSTVPWPNHASI